MYSGALIMLAGVPLALGSWWGLAPVVLLALAIIWRLLDEEKFLAANLPGYSEYQEQVKYRLVPLAAGRRAPSARLLGITRTGLPSMKARMSSTMSGK